jgi:hypothetical protein
MPCSSANEAGGVAGGKVDRVSRWMSGAGMGLVKVYPGQWKGLKLESHFVFGTPLARDLPVTCGARLPAFLLLYVQYMYVPHVNHHLPPVL